MTVPSELIMLLTSSNLIVILYYIERDIKKVEYIKERLADLGFKNINSNVGWKQFYKGFNTLEEFQSIPSERGGQCLSNE